jgi:porphobilinogen synthase
MRERILPYQYSKPSRLRSDPRVRSLVKETRVSNENLVMPIFFKETDGAEPIGSMPGIEKMGEEVILRAVEELWGAGIKSILLFGSSDKRCSAGTISHDRESPFHRTISRIRENSDMLIMADVCLCAYTDHRHCGIIKDKASGAKQGSIIDNEKTVEALAEAALSYVDAGADVVAPSAMADGQVKAIRERLDESGHLDICIMSYSAKYASNFYAPFRDIYSSGPSFGDRKTYQMDPSNKREAIKEVSIDINEGADVVMVKPALAFLDIISAVKDRFAVPVAAYNVSGEYSMVKAAALKGWLDEPSCVMEILTSVKRAGADIIITYWAREATEWLKGQG